MRDLTVFIISSGEPSTDECIRRVELQKHVDFKLEIIAYIHPMNRAFQAMLDRCKTPYFVQVDADMLLGETAICRLYESMLERPGIAFVCGWLWGDCEEMPIQGVKLYNHAVCRKYPYKESLSCEMDQVSRMSEAYYSLPPWEILGLHSSLQTEEMAFRRWKRLAIKHRSQPCMHWVSGKIGELEVQLCDGARKAAYMGAMAGMSAPMVSYEEDSSAIDPDYCRIMGPRIGPSDLTIYSTTKCNKKCEFCLRQYQKIEHDDFSPGLALDVLDKFPTIQSVCIAGFGEPLLHPDIGLLVEVCREAGKMVNVITNGIEWEKLATLPMHQRPNIVSVSIENPDVELQFAKRLHESGFYVYCYFLMNSLNIYETRRYAEKARDAGIYHIGFLNLLPHAGCNSDYFSKRCIRHGTVEADFVEKCKKQPWSRNVQFWPRPVGGKGGQCLSPWVSIGVDGNGSITGCRRCMPPGPGNGFYFDPGVWTGSYMENLRLAILGDRELPTVCEHCFGFYGSDKNNVLTIFR